MNPNIDNLEISQSEGIPSNRLIEFFQDSLRPVSWAYTAWLFFAMAMSIMVFVFFRYWPLGSIVPSLLVYYIVLLVHVVLRLKTGGKANVLAPDMLFLLFYTLFHLGYITLYALGQVPYSNYIFYFVSSVPKALLIVNLGLVGFIFGFEIAGIRNPVFIAQQTCKIPTRGWCSIGLVLMVLALVMHFIGLALVGPERIIEKGYTAFSAVYLQDVWPASLFLNRSIYALVLGLVVYLIASALRYGKLFKSKLVLGIAIAFIVLVILEGDRGPILKIIAPILMVRHYLIKHIRIRYLILTFIGFMFLFAAMAVVRTIALAPKQMLEEYKYQRSAGMVDWQSPFAEMGGSFLVVNIVAHDVPSAVPYWKGETWAAAVLHFVPYLYGYFFHHGWIKTTPSEWITYTYFGPKAAGKAFTVAAEGYLNFGLIGAFVETMLCGLFIRWLIIKFSKSPSAMWAFITLGCLAAVFQIVRNYMYTVSDVCIQFFLAGILLNLVFGNEPESEIIETDYLLEYG